MLLSDDEFCVLLGWLLVLPKVEDCELLGDCELPLTEELEPCVPLELRFEFCELEDEGEDEVLFMVELEPGDVVDVPDEDCIELLEVWACRRTAANNADVPQAINLVVFMYFPLVQLPVRRATCAPS